jgi:hypothetical protein
LKYNRFYQINGAGKMNEALSGRLVAVARDQVSCDLGGGESAILNLKKGIYYGINPIGSFIWSLIQEPREFDEIRNLILKEYDVEPERCEKSLQKFLNDLSAQGLIEFMDKSGA